MSKNAKPWKEALTLVAGEIGPSGQPRIVELAQKTFFLAGEGDVNAIKEIGDRLDGRPPQQTTLTNDPEAPFQMISATPLSSAEWEEKYAPNKSNGHANGQTD